MSTIKHRPATERFWRAAVRQWRGSGLSVRAYCEKYGLSEPSFYAWRRRLTDAAAATPPFVRVKVVPDVEVLPTMAAGGAASALELVLGDHRRLRIAPGFDEPTLRRLLALLEGRP